MIVDLCEYYCVCYSPTSSRAVIHCVGLTFAPQKICVVFRSLTITSELTDADGFDNIYTTPYKEWWECYPGGDPIWVYSEIYNSDAMLQADWKMHNNLWMPRPEDNLETFLITALLYSNSTHLASFGSALLWPMYLFLGNVSKYIHSKPTSLCPSCYIYSYSTLSPAF